ncbi:MAG: DNA-deoxyinosine glycosylase [Dokdonella sp.]|uniref:DNA-deoxyinosine glycosylase n=1 Tax=Dokdonella sp. TaxID=2291710 RepID=UPI003267908D
MPDSRKPSSDTKRRRPMAVTGRVENSQLVPIVTSFPAEVTEGCRVLVLGTMPGVRSLEKQQFYAHPRNLFWPLMGEFFDAGPEVPYDARLARVQAYGVGLWDVLRQCERTGSLDGAIRAGSEVPNDIGALLEQHPTIGAIALNGAKAADMFLLRIAPMIDASRLARIALLPMPSTSPANASLSLSAKRERWFRLRRWLSENHRA